MKELREKMAEICSGRNLVEKLGFEGKLQIQIGKDRADAILSLPEFKEMVEKAEMYDLIMQRLEVEEYATLEMTQGVFQGNITRPPTAEEVMEFLIFFFSVRGSLNCLSEDWLFTRLILLDNNQYGFKLSNGGILHMTEVRR